MLEISLSLFLYLFIFLYLSLFIPSKILLPLPSLWSLWTVSRPVNNAGIGLVGPLESIPMEEMKKVFETNFFGVIRMIKEVMPDMKKRRGGHIIVVSSVMGLQGTV